MDFWSKIENENSQAEQLRLSRKFMVLELERVSKRLPPGVHELVREIEVPLSDREEQKVRAWNLLAGQAQDSDEWRLTRASVVLAATTGTIDEADLFIDLLSGIECSREEMEQRLCVVFGLTDV